MSSQPTPAAISAAIRAGRIFENRAELIEAAKILEGYEFMDYDGGIWAFWDGETVGAIASVEFAKALTQAVQEGSGGARVQKDLEGLQGEKSEEDVQDREQGGMTDQ